MLVRRRLAALLVGVLATLVGLLVGASAGSAAPPYTHHPHISCAPFHPIVHTHITCNGDGYLPHDHVVITLHTKTYHLGSVNTNAAGAFTGKVLQLPPRVVGLHTVTGTGRGGVPTDSASTLVEPVSPHGTQGGGAGSGGGGLSSTGVAVIGFGVVGVGLIVAGVLFLASARRRKALV